MCVCVCVCDLMYSLLLLSFTSIPAPPGFSSIWSTYIHIHTCTVYEHTVTYTHNKHTMKCNINVFSVPSLSPQPGIRGILLVLRGRGVRICVREVSLTLVHFTHLNVCSSAYENGCMVNGMCAIWQWIEYYYYLFLTPI